MFLALPFQRLLAAPRHRRVLVLLLAVLLTACGSGVGGAEDGSLADTAARVEIVQTGLLFTERGQIRQLTARVFDSSGVRLDTPVRWSSSDPANIGIGADGIARAERAVGSSQIVASVGDIRSAPLLAVVVRVAAGTVLVDDAQIVRGVVETDPDAEPSLDNTYTVVVSGIDAPPAGTLMSGTGSEPVAGRVVSTRAVVGGVEVTLKLVPLPELFPGLEIDQRFDLSQVPVSVPDGVGASYDVQREGNTYSFTPRASTAKSAGAKLGTPAGTGALFDQGCEASVGGVGFGDGAPPFVFEPQPVFSITIAPALDVIYTEARGLERFVATAEPAFLIDGTVKATVAFEGKIECRAELLVFRIPVGGPLSALISGLVPVGVGFEVGGKVTVAQLKFGFRSRTSAQAAVGLACNGDCEFVSELTDFVSTNTPTVDLPGGEDFRVKPELSAFGYVEVASGNPLFRSLKFSAFEFKAGPKLEGEFAPVATQIAATDFKSAYKLSLGVSAGFGDDIEQVLNMLGVVKVGDEVLEKTTELANSPTGVLTVNRDRFFTGETAEFELKLDPATAAFLGLYNVSDIVLVRNSGGQREVARVPATNGQTTFNFTFVAPDAGLTSEFTAFAVTRLLPTDLLSLELDTARATNAVPVAVDDSFTTTEDSAAETIAVLDNDADADGDPLEVRAVTQPARGQATIAPDRASVSYRPAPGFTGTETFEYTVNDGKGGSDEGKVTVEVQPRTASSASLIAVINRTSASALACSTNVPGDCESAGLSNRDEREETVSTGFSRSLQTSASAAQSKGEAQGNSSGSGTVTLDRADGSVGEIAISCDETGTFGAGRETRNRDRGEGGSNTRASVDFLIEGEAGLSYSVAVLSSSASAPSGSPTLPILASASVDVGLSSPSANLFTITRSSSGVFQSGNDSGRLGPGIHALSVICSASGRDGPDSGYAGGGSASSAMSVRLSLTP